MGNGGCQFGKCIGAAGNKAGAGKYIALAALEQAADDEEIDCSGSGLTFGVSSFHIKALCENPFAGGRGFTLKEIGDMTPDQICFALCDLKLFRRDAEGRRVVKVKGLRKGGMTPGRLADGTKVFKHSGGKTKLQMLREKLAEEAKKKC